MNTRFSQDEIKAEIERNKVKNSEYSKFEVLESFYLPEKCIATYKTGLLFKQIKYFVCVLRTQKEKDKSETTYFDPIFSTTVLDDAIFVWNNIYIFDLLQRSRKYRNDVISISKIDDELRKKKQSEINLSVKKPSKNDMQFKVTVSSSENDDLFGGEIKGAYVPFSERLDCLDDDTKNLIKIYC